MEALGLSILLSISHLALEVTSYRPFVLPTTGHPSTPPPPSSTLLTSSYTEQGSLTGLYKGGLHQQISSTSSHGLLSVLFTDVVTKPTAVLGP